MDLLAFKNSGIDILVDCCGMPQRCVTVCRRVDVYSTLFWMCEGAG